MGWSYLAYSVYSVKLVISKKDTAEITFWKDVRIWNCFSFALGVEEGKIIKIFKIMNGREVGSCHRTRSKEQSVKMEDRRF